MNPRKRGLVLLSAVAVMVPGAPAAVAEPLRVKVAPLSIPSDCSTDVSTPLESWLQSVPDGSVARLRAGGCYRVEREVVVAGKQDWHLDGAGATLRRTEYTPPELRYPSANAVLRLVDLTSSQITGLRVQGTNGAPDLPYLPPDVGSYRQEVEFDHGLALHGLVSTTVSDVKVRSVWGDGVYLSGGDQWTTRWSHQVVLRDISVIQNGRQGIAVNRSRHVIIDGADVHFSRRAAIDLEPDTPGETMSDIEIRNSRLGSNLLAIASAGAGRVNRVDIHDNVVWRTGVPWVYSRSMTGLKRHGWTVRDNVVTQVLGSPMPAMAFWNTSGVRISGNRLAVATTQSQQAVGLWEGSEAAVVSCNVFLGAARDFIDAPPSTGVRVWRNALTPVGRGCTGSKRPHPGTSKVPIPDVAVGYSAPLVGFARERLGVPGGNHFDRELQASVARLQQSRGWTPTGTIDAPVWRILTSKKGLAR